MLYLFFQNLLNTKTFLLTKFNSSIYLLFKQIYKSFVVLIQESQGQSQLENS